MQERFEYMILIDKGYLMCRKTRLWIYVCAIVMLLTSNACSKKQVSDKDVFLWYIEQIDYKLPKGEHSVIIVPTASCIGCRKAAVNYGALHKGKVTVIVSGSIASEFEGYPMIVDSNSLCNDLNWLHSNIIEVFLKNGEVKEVKSYDAMESIKRFSGVDVSSIENCTDKNCRTTE